METYTIKIKETFLQSIQNGSQKRIYRLNNISSKIRKEDFLIFYSDTLKENFVRARIMQIETFLSWEDALKKYWEEDFSHIFTSFDNAIIEHRKKYSKNEVDKYGIIVIRFALISMCDLESSNVLLDTNIFIYRESYNNAVGDAAKLYSLFDKLSIKKFLHPNIKNEIGKNKDQRARSNLLLKIGAYNILTPSKIESIFFIETLRSFPQNINSEIDNELLYQVYSNSVDYLITDDKEMLRKADVLFIRSNVFSISEFITLIETKFPSFIEYKILKVKKETFGDCDLNSEFFKTLKEDYFIDDKRNFDLWFNRKRKSNEPVYVYRENNEIKGFLYIKVEEEGGIDFEPNLIAKKRLKIGTFKIVSTGKRVGERFLKIIFHNAIKQNVDEIYVTLFPNKREEVKALLALLQKWGFVECGIKISTNEIVLIKDMKHYYSEKNQKFNYPNIQRLPNYFFLPIESEFHTDLFPDFALTNEDISFYDDNEAHRYALEKVYISGKHKNQINVKSGDILVIYRNGERWPKKYSSVVTGTAIVESIEEPNTIEVFLNECKNITVFSQEELKNFFFTKKYRMIVKLIDLDAFQKKVTLDKLQQKGIVEENSGPRPFQTMTTKQFSDIIKLNKGEEDE